MQFSFVRHKAAITVCRHTHALCVLNFPPVRLDDPAEFARRIIGQLVASNYRITAVTFNFYPGDDVYHPQIHISNPENLAATIHWPAARVELDEDYRVRVIESPTAYHEATGETLCYDMESVTVYGYMGVTERTQSQVPRRKGGIHSLDFSTKEELTCQEGSWDVNVKRSKGPLVNTMDLARIGRGVVSHTGLELMVEQPVLRAMDQIGRDLAWHYGYDGVMTMGRKQSTIVEVFAVIVHGLWVDYIEYVDTTLGRGESRPALTVGDYPRDVAVRPTYYNSAPLAFLMSLRKLTAVHDNPRYITWEYEGDKVLRNDTDDVERLFRGEGDHMMSWDEFKELVSCVSAESVYQLHDRYAVHLENNPDTQLTVLGFYLTTHVQPILKERAAKKRAEEDRAVEEKRQAESVAEKSEVITGEADGDDAIRYGYAAYRSTTPPAGQRHMQFGQFRARMHELNYAHYNADELNNVGRGFNEYVTIQH